MKFFNFLSPAANILNKINKYIDVVEEYQEEYKNYSNKELKEKTKFFLRRIELGESVDDLLPEALATVREAAFRAHGVFAYRTQLIGALIIYGGNFAEMKTGEGKTLTIALAAYISALTQEGVHVVTVNEYLVKRDAEFCRKILNFLGMTVGFNTSNLKKDMKQKMYKCHVTYTTNSELAFDYLKDNMVYNAKDITIPKLNFAIIDEGDSVLIDEAKTPLIISGIDEQNLTVYIDVDIAIKKLTQKDYVIDYETKTVSLLSSGIIKLEKYFNIKQLYIFENSDLIHRIQNSLLANFIFMNGREYIVHDNQIIIIDPYTGRLLYGQTYNAGLHQAIQAKEYVSISPENKIVANITYQSFFRLYKKIAALSGTAISEQKEFSETYNMIVVPVPTNKPIIRKDLPDIVFGTKDAKIKAIIDEIKKHYIVGQPVLVGTASVLDSEIIYQILRSENIPCEILNAKNHDKEGEIISRAGKKYAITIATNIAGRGVDIKIEEDVKKLGGLFVLGAERNESRRIDNQLRGRAGRQGDPGKSIFYISMQDNLFKRFGADKFEKLSKKMQDKFFDSRYISKTLTNIQKRIQSLNFDARKNLIEYNEVLNKQQQLIYKQRYFILTSHDNIPVLERIIKKVSSAIIVDFQEKTELKRLEIGKMVKFLNETYFYYPLLEENDFKDKTITEIKEFLIFAFKKNIELKMEKITKEIFNEYVKNIFIKSIDNIWQEHLDFAMKLKNNVPLRSLEQKSPLYIYVEDVAKSFEDLLVTCGKMIIKKIFLIQGAFVEDKCYEYLEEFRKKQEIFRK